MPKKPTRKTARKSAPKPEPAPEAKAEPTPEPIHAPKANDANPAYHARCAEHYRNWQRRAKKAHAAIYRGYTAEQLQAEIDKHAALAK